MPRDTRRAFLAELDKVSPQIARAFEEAIQDVRSTAQMRVIEEAIERAIRTGNIGQGVREVTAALQLGAEFFAPLDQSIDAAFRAGAVYQLSTLPKPSSNTAPYLQVRFQGRHPRAEAWTRTAAARLITEVTLDTQEVIRGTIAEAVEQSRSYRKVAQDLIGRTEGNQRKGGLIGLHSRQAAAVRKARAELEELDSSYFRREKRDRRFDPMIRKAIKDGKSLARADIDRITGRYSDRLLKVRADTIARTEGNGAMNAGRHESTQQMIDDGKVPVEAVTKIWDATPGPRTRDSHRALNGQEIRWGEMFVSPVTGALLAHPHDENAPAAETVNCRCSERIRIDWAMVARIARRAA
ncbi:phage minor head protein [Pseudooceanicola sp. C21-150M6]|uniref:phage minor head protein n=1 Tax=Pseudooceanicola sp. C21-150M6 TaxID=3434355 RepID=UPI003D7FFC43